MKLNLTFRFIITLLLLLSLNVFAQEAKLIETNVAVEEQVQRLSKELRCLVCQNQTLADSHAGLAEDLKQEIREMAKKGMTDKAIVDYLVARYGDFVRYKPALNSMTAMLWLGPFTLLLAGGIGLFVMLRRRQKMTSDQPLSEDEIRKVSELLNK
jgi:cytochrome c-type biogenesis protein CcmH